MKKLVIGLLLAISAMSFSEDKEKYIDETAFVKELVYIENVSKIPSKDWRMENNTEIVRGINEELTPEIEKKILEIPDANIIYKSYIFGKDCIKVRVLYIEDLKSKKIYK